MSRQTRRIVPVIREQLEKNVDTLDKNKPTRPVFHALPFESCSPVNKYNNDDNYYIWDILKNKNMNEEVVPGFWLYRFGSFVRNSIDFFDIV